MKSNLLLIFGVCVILGSVIFTYYYFFNNGGEDDAVITPVDVEVVEYGDDGFSHDIAEIAQETVISFRNSSREILKIEFVDRPRFDMAEIAPGETSLSLPLFESGIYEYRNVRNPSHTGQVEVQ